MSEDRLPSRRVADGVAKSSESALPVRPSAQLPRVYGAAALEFVDFPDRNECWDMLSDAVTARIRSAAGRMLEWWAIQNTVGRVQAVVLGTHALVVARPTLSQDGRRVHQLLTYPIQEGSFRFVEMRVPEASGRRAWPTPGAASRSNEPMRTELSGLDQSMRTFLGNLPERAQTYLQLPFIEVDWAVESEHYYFRTEGRSSIDLGVWCFLTDRRTLTFASGHRTSRVGLPQELGSWNLICRQARVGRSTGGVMPYSEPAR